MLRFWLDSIDPVSGTTHIAEGMQWGDSTLTIRMLGVLPPVATFGYATFATAAELALNYPTLTKTMID